jgi:hypothetical protein
MQGKCDSINKNNVYNCLSHRFHNEQAQICAEGCEGGLLLHRLVWPFFVIRFYIWTGLDNTYLGFTGHVIVGPSGVRALPLAAGRNEGSHFFKYIFPLFFSFLGTTVIQNHRRGCLIVSNFCMGP